MASSWYRPFGNVCLHEMGAALPLRSCGFRVHAWLNLNGRKFASFQLSPKYVDFGEPQESQGAELNRF